jgi:2'-5' RNA ligase
METIRAFIAVDIGDDIRSQLDVLQRKLKRVDAGVRWVKPAGIHLTLAFLGDIPADGLAPLRQALDTGLAGLEAFDLEAAGSGFFGRPKHPRVIWAGVAPSPSLTKLQRRTAVAVRQAGLALDNKPFSPHLTLGRFRTPGRTKALLEALEHDQDQPLGRTRIDRVELIRSILTPAGAEYHTLHEVPLARPGGA